MAKFVCATFKNSIVCHLQGLGTDRRGGRGDQRNYLFWHVHRTCPELFFLSSFVLQWGSFKVVLLKLSSGVGYFYETEPKISDGWAGLCADLAWLRHFNFMSFFYFLELFCIQFYLSLVFLLISNLTNGLCLHQFLRTRTTEVNKFLKTHANGAHLDYHKRQNEVVTIQFCFWVLKSQLLVRSMLCFAFTKLTTGLISKYFEFIWREI